MFLYYFSIFLISFCAGFFTKATDFLDKKPKKINYLFSFFYGVILGFLSSKTKLSNLYISLAISNILAGKIDSYPHIFGLLVFVFFIFLFDISYLDPWLFIFFFVLGLLDELYHKSKFKLLSSRLLSPTGAFFIFILFSEPIYFVSILGFDIGYNLFIFLKQKFKYKF